MAKESIDLFKPLAAAVFSVALIIGGWFCSFLMDRIEDLQARLTAMEPKVVRHEENLKQHADLLVEELTYWRNYQRRKLEETPSASTP
jgi:hypothetical protein